MAESPAPDARLPFRPVGVRPAGQPGGGLRWVDPGGHGLDVGARVVVRDGDAEWLGEVAVAAARIVEVPPLHDLPVIARLADPAEWPAAPPRASQTLLRSLDLPS